MASPYTPSESVLEVRVLSVVGTRPQFVKLAPVHAELRAAGLDHVVIHTGQHHDSSLSGTFYDDLGLPAPDVHLGVGSLSPCAQVALMLQACEAPMEQLRPDVVISYGDTNSTLAGALAAAKCDLPGVHVEAGVRSFDLSMPEEVNRVSVDHMSILCLAPTETAVTNLHAEGLESRTRLVGDVMVDRLRLTLATVSESDTAPEVDPTRPFLLATVHRPENTDDPERLRAIVDALASSELPVLLPAHPRLVHKAGDAGIRLERGAIRVAKPLSHRSLVATLQRARALVTDSGGLTKEAHLLGVPCTTIRSTIEWPETLVDGANVLCPRPERLIETALRSVAIAPHDIQTSASKLVVESILERFGSNP
jgi:UDP-N-acetylglucosamine 2-epimerase (non-hydrolysing)